MTPHRIPIQAKTPLTSRKPDSLAKGCAVGLATGVLIWIALIVLAITEFLGIC